MGEGHKEAPRVNFEGKREFHSAKITSDVELLTYKEKQSE